MHGNLAAGRPILGQAGPTRGDSACVARTVHPTLLRAHGSLVPQPLFPFWGRQGRRLRIA